MAKSKNFNINFDHYGHLLINFFVLGLFFLSKNRIFDSTYFDGKLKKWNNFGEKILFCLKIVIFSYISVNFGISAKYKKKH